MFTYYRVCRLKCYRFSLNHL